MKTIKLLLLLLLIPIIGKAQTYVYLDSIAPSPYIDYKIKYYDYNAETLLEYRYEDFIRNDTLEYIVYSNAEEPWNPYTCDNSYVVIAQIMIAGEEVSILFKDMIEKEIYSFYSIKFFTMKLKSEERYEVL